MFVGKYQQLNRQQVKTHRACKIRDVNLGGRCVVAKALDEVPYGISVWTSGIKLR